MQKGHGMGDRYGDCGIFIKNKEFWEKRGKGKREGLKREDGEDGCVKKEVVEDMAGRKEEEVEARATENSIECEQTERKRKRSAQADAKDEEVESKKFKAEEVKDEDFGYYTVESGLGLF